MLFSVNEFGKPGLFESVEPLDFIWQQIDGVDLSVHHNDIHEREILIVSPDENFLFVVRNTFEPGKEYWTEVIDISRPDPKVIVVGPTCCESDDPLLRVHDRRVRERAVSMGLSPDNYQYPVSSQRRH